MLHVSSVVVKQKKTIDFLLLVNGVGRGEGGIYNIKNMNRFNLN